MGAPGAVETPRLRLRPPCPADGPRAAPLLDDWQVARYTSHIPHPYSEARWREWLDLTAADHAEGVALDFMIERKSDGALLGGIGLRRGETPADAVAGYWLGRPHWGDGVATEALAATLDTGFALGYERIQAAALPVNIASIRVQQKCGMRYIGQGREWAPARDMHFHVLLHAINRADWAARRGAGVLLVAAVALVDGDGRVLLAQRPQGKPLAGLWEFPGGKVAGGETPETALIRELREELGIDTEESCLAPFTFASHRYEAFHLLMPLYVCRVWQGVPRPLEGQQLAWVRPIRMGDYPMPPADKPLVAMLRDLL